MLGPFRRTITGRSITRTPIPAEKDRFIRRLYGSLGRAKLYRRRAAPLLKHRKATSYPMMLAYVADAGIDIGPPPHDWVSHWF